MIPWFWDALVLNFASILKANSHGVPNPTHVSKSKHGGNLPTFEPQETINVGCWLVYAKSLAGLVLKVGSRLLLNPIVKTSPKTRLQKVMPCSTHVIFGTWNPCGVVSPTFHALNGWDCIDWAQVTWDPVWTSPHIQLKSLSTVVHWDNSLSLHVSIIYFKHKCVLLYGVKQCTIECLIDCSNN
jgi:hypothetical protein